MSFVVLERRRMKPHQNEEAAHIDHAVAIELQLRNGDAPDVSQGNKEKKILIPSEMLAPTVHSRMVKRNHCLTAAVESFDFILLVSVAADTRIHEVIRKCQSASGTRLDMLCDKWGSAECRRCSAIFALPAGTMSNFGTKLLRHILRQLQEP